MRQYHRVFWTHEEIAESLLHRGDESVIKSGEVFQLDRILDRFLTRRDSERLCESSVTLSLSALGDALEWNLFLRDRVSGASATGGSLLQMAAGAGLGDN